MRAIKKKKRIVQQWIVDNLCVLRGCRWPYRKIAIFIDIRKVKTNYVCEEEEEYVL